MIATLNLSRILKTELGIHFLKILFTYILHFEINSYSCIVCITDGYESKGTRLYYCGSKFTGP